jgi:tetratricopeptide (TPR) repeat protein
MSSQTSRIHWLGRTGIATFVTCTALYAMPAIGQVYNAHVGKDVNDVDPHYCPHEQGLPIDGQVRTVDNSPLPQDVRVRLETEDGAFAAQQFVSADGRFRFLSVEGNSYRIVVTAKGFQTVRKEVGDTWGASHSPTIYLVPLVKKNAALPAESATDLAAPKQARKEYERGSRELEGGNLEEARKHLEKAVVEDPCYACAQTALGVTLSRQQQLAAAESAFHNSIKCDGGYLEAYLQLAILLKGQKKYKECETALQQGLRRFPNEWGLHYQLGNAQEGSGDYEAAEQEFLKAQTLNAELPPAFHLRLADLYRNWKKYDKARAEMETYLRADPDGQFAEATRKMLREMEASGLVSGVPSKADQGKP